MKTANVAAALVSTTAISMAPNLILFFAPNFASSQIEKRSILLSLGQALAAGCLLGDVFLHTLPHCLLGHDEADAQKLGLHILGGFLTFFVLDILIRSINDEYHDHDHHMPHTQNKKEECKDKNMIVTETERSLTFSPTMLLNLAADSMHNFTDGIAIGTSFATASLSSSIQSLPLKSQVAALLRSSGGVVSLAVLCHEIPHELGDFAILVSAGMSKRQAITSQFGTAIAAYCGTIFGLYAIDRMGDSVGYDTMIPFTAGGFVYLSCVSILPDLLQEKRRKKYDRFFLLVAFILGIAFMYGVALLEHDHGHIGHDHSTHHDHHHHNDHHHNDHHHNDHHHNDQHHNDHHHDDHHHDETCHLASNGEC